MNSGVQAERQIAGGAESNAENAGTFFGPEAGGVDQRSVAVVHVLLGVVVVVVTSACCLAVLGPLVPFFVFVVV